MLVVAVDPPFFNNQRVEENVVFWFKRPSLIAGGLWRNPQSALLVSKYF